MTGGISLRLITLTIQSSLALCRGFFFELEIMRVAYSSRSQGKPGRLGCRVLGGRKALVVAATGCLVR